MAPLPDTLPEELEDSTKVLNAYDICLKFEKSLQQYIDNGKDVGRNLVYIRILGYLILYVPTDKGLETVVREISSCPDDSALLNLGKMYFDHYLRAFRSNKGPTPTPSNHASRPSFDTLADMINDTLVEAPQSYADAKKNALIRDGNRCVVTGIYDARSVMEIRELHDKVRLDPSLAIEATECAHIFADSTNPSIEPGSSKRDYAASMWAVMHRFGYEELPDDLNGPKIHRLENVMTLVHGFHVYFDRLDVWFVATKEKNKYRLEAADNLVLRRYPEYVTFTTDDEEKLPVPSPAYLAIHAACAKVAHSSGAGECIYKFYRDMDGSTTLDPNGASAEILQDAIFGLQASGYEITV